MYLFLENECIRQYSDIVNTGKTYEKMCKIKRDESIWIKTEVIEKINRVEDIETSEREDVFTAIGLLMENSPLEISCEKWMLWFDEVRDF